MEKRNLLYSSIISVLGAMIIILDLILKISSRISCIGYGLFLAGCIFIIFNFFNLKISKRLKKLEDDECSEKNILLKEKINSKVYSAFVYIECLCIIIVSFFNYKRVVGILSVLVFAKLVTWIIICSKFTKDTEEE